MLFVAQSACAQVTGTDRTNATGTASPVVAQVRSCLDQGQGKRAVQIIEDELASNPASRAELVDWLKKSYESAIVEAARNGRTAEAADYKDCLAILNRRPKRVEPGRAQAQPAAPAPAESQQAAPNFPVAAERSSSPQVPPASNGPDLSTKPKDNPPPLEPPRTAQIVSPSANSSTRRPSGAPLPRPENLLIQEPDDSGGLTPFPSPAESKPNPVAPEMAKARPSTIKDVALEKVSQDQDQGPAPPRSAQQPDHIEPIARDQHEMDPIAQADALFREKRYEEAGQIYSAHYRDGTLPENRNPIWAYCRRYTVVKRINAGPKSQAEWQSIREEIERIQEFSPKHWYDQYLLEFVQENSRKTDGSTKKPLAAPGKPNRGGLGTGQNLPQNQNSLVVPDVKPSDLLVIPARETSYKQQTPPDSTTISLRDTGVIRR